MQKKISCALERISNDFSCGFIGVKKTYFYCEGVKFNFDFSLYKEDLELLEKLVFALRHDKAEIVFKD